MFTTKLMTFCLATAVTASGVVLLAPNASARQLPIVVTAPADMVVRHVSYADLNLGSRLGERRLHYRVSDAVDSLCTEATGGFGIGGLRSRIDMVGCSQSSWNQAQPQIDRAVNRARQIAATGSSSIAAAAITISIPQ